MPALPQFLKNKTVLIILGVILVFCVLTFIFFTQYQEQTRYKEVYEPTQERLTQQQNFVEATIDKYKGTRIDGFDETGSELTFVLGEVEASKLSKDNFILTFESSSLPFLEKDLGIVEIQNSGDYESRFTTNLTPSAFVTRYVAFLNSKLVKEPILNNLKFQAIPVSEKGICVAQEFEGNCSPPTHKEFVYFISLGGYPVSNISRMNNIQVWSPISGGASIVTIPNFLPSYISVHTIRAFSEGTYILRPSAPLDPYYFDLFFNLGGIPKSYVAFDETGFSKIYVMNSKDGVLIPYVAKKASIKGFGNKVLEIYYSEY
ncbi:MAG: hypothetical protein AAB443_01505 [Patescibacteria group bacterium]